MIFVVSFFNCQNLNQLLYCEVYTEIAVLTTYYYTACVNISIVFYNQTLARTEITSYIIVLTF